MPLPAPPMYVKIPRKVPPTGRRAVVVVPPAPPAVEEELDEGEEEEVEEDDDGEEEEDDDGAESSEGVHLSSRQRSKLSKWSEEMSQKNLYKLAKGAGLEVRSRDAKEDLIKKIKDALG
jgi:ribosomal protein L12E/L44/L45/RPP1/RPP2